MKSLRTLAVGTMLVLAAMALSGCGGSNTMSTSSAQSVKPAEKPAFALDSAKAVDQSVSAAEGGFVALETPGKDLVQVSFPRGSLAQNSQLVVTPLTSAPKGSKDVVANGVLVEEKGTGAGPKLVYPAVLSITVPKELPKEISIVRYRDDGSGFDVIPSSVVVRKGTTQLVAQVNGFSAYGAAAVSQAEIDKAAAAQTEKDFNWVIYVKDTSEISQGPMKYTISLDLKAVNTAGDIMGTYTGSATSKTTSEMNAGGGKVSAEAKSTSTALEIKMGPYLTPLEPLGEADPKDLAPLPTAAPDFSGSGSITMATTGKGTVSAGGYSTSKGIANNSTTPIEVNVIGPQVRMLVKTPQGTVYFDGYIIGEGR
ncbi:MAG: hypothetical protein WCJ13_00770 [Coriobacteriia bacterium]